MVKNGYWFMVKKEQGIGNWDLEKKEFGERRKGIYDASKPFKGSKRLKGYSGWKPILYRFIIYN